MTLHHPSFNVDETVLLSVRDVAKSFTMHLRDGLVLPVVNNVSFELHRGECVVLGGPSGVGKSSILRMVYGNYAIDQGEIWVRDAKSGTMRDLGSGDPRLVLELRNESIGYVSQFLRAVPRVSALDVVAGPLLARGIDRSEALEKAEAMLLRLNLPHTLFSLPPATFSGGEKQRVNIARGFITDHPILLLDEPTASLDAENRDIVVAMIAEKTSAGAAVLGIFHDQPVRDAVATRILDVSTFSARKVSA
ncbi:phosphonate C-P lyase system protein PhnL [Agrobacterium rubi]|uniref:Phosphonate C-P lyase system protein PhnL n=2 Tax=Agrobacterium rubi TaxID=28099 RepID=A0AAE7R909_9HYPH|nr:phosphonate C-P lyase system protein PhnL [Agrobacterium rubi]MBP1878844.1 alpha-D-ribose 1-methylphosphonate 5-triphosphate synthase subunit PhnL [Agrobacterium rubi]MCL6652799.1 phosphonate C-P lyase system protein PhnL [Agrobacterium rubi]NTE88537.1 phosphonate C-P lyase system protein PhnL [Agrobacterium rubi]NTF04365.1 phosphonate C-P lyase system protein PhnL [Agrobacterium rubi]NTF09898.1 phosphonate C-P lyase system protein PhnL [Agrobacterium rubi]